MITLIEENTKSVVYQLTHESNSRNLVFNKEDTFNNDIDYQELANKEYEKWLEWLKV
jgi:hypothetical protein